MADVTGHFGDQPVELNNAATEATLKTLLAIAKVDSKNLLELAKKVLGPDAANLKAFEEALEANSEALDKSTKLEDARLIQIDEQIKKYNKINTVIGQLDVTMTKLMNGSGKASDVFTALEKLPGVAGMVASGFTRLATIQEENFETYQKLTDVGVGFSGSLTNMRIAAANSYLTLNEFANVIKNNSRLMSMLGGTADQGAVSFAKISNAMIKSDAGTYLTSLGYTAEQLNGGLANYLTMTGGRNAQELKNTKDISEAAAGYMEQLDGLARVTGESREQQQAAMKEQAANAAWQAKLATMSEKDKEKAMAGLANALAVGGKGAADAFQAKIMGVPPLSREAQIFTSTMSNANRSIMKSAETAMDGTKSMADMNESFFTAANGIQVDMSKYSKEQVAAIIAAGGPMGKAFQDAQAHVNQFGKQTDEQRRAALAKQEIDKSQAADMAAAMKSLKELGAALWTAFSPVIGALTTVIGWVGKLAGGFASLMDAGGALTKIIATVSLIYAGYVAWKLKSMALEKAGSIASAIGGGAGGAASAAGGGLGKALSGIGPGIGAVLTGLAEGLKAMGKGSVEILLGAATLSGVIVILAAGLAASAWLIGKALPTLAEGFKSFNDIDGKNLTDVALGIGALGLAFGAFGAGSAIGQAGNTLSQLWGGLTKLFGGTDMLGTITETLKTLGPEVDTLTKLGDSLVKLGDGMTAYGKAVASIDIVKAERVKELMKGPSAAEQVANAGAKLFTAAADRISTAVTNSNNPEKTSSDLQALNTTMREMLKYMKDATANTERTYKVIEDKKGKVW